METWELFQKASQPSLFLWKDFVEDKKCLSFGSPWDLARAACQELMKGSGSRQNRQKLVAECLQTFEGQDYQSPLVDLHSGEFAFRTHRLQMLRLLLRCAHEALESDFLSHQISSERVREIADENNAPFGLVFDLLKELGLALQGRAPLTGARVEFPVVLPCGEMGQRLAVLLEPIPAGPGDLYPHPDTCFLFLAQEFVEAMNTAFALAKNEADLRGDVRWRLLPPPPGRDPGPSLGGPSCGLAFAIGLAKLGGGPSPRPWASRLRNMQIQNILFTGEIDRQGGIYPVGGLDFKFAANTINNTTPHIHLCAVSMDQELDPTDFPDCGPGVKLCRSQTGNLTAARSHRVDELVDLLGEALRVWGNYSYIIEHTDPHFTGRDALFNAIEQWENSCDSGYLILDAPAGFGKTTFLSELLRRRQEDPDHARAPIFHFIRYNDPDTYRPEHVADHLRLALCRKHNLREEKESDAGERLRETLAVLSRELALRKESETLFIDAADQLEEGALLAPAILKDLPPGIRCLITTRSTQRWRREREVSMQTWDLRVMFDARDDIEAYLLKRNQELAGRR